MQSIDACGGTSCHGDAVTAGAIQHYSIGGATRQELRFYGLAARLGFRDETPLYDGSPQPYAELFVMNADGSDQRPITSDKWEEGTPAWVPVMPQQQQGKK